MRGEITKLSLSCTAFLFLCMLVCVVVGVASAKTIYMPDDYAKIQRTVNNATDGVSEDMYVEIDGDTDKYSFMEPFENYITQPTPQDSDGLSVGDKFDDIFVSKSVERILPSSEVQGDIWTNKGGEGPGTDGGSFAIGESITIYFWVSEDMYIEIWDELPDGTTKVIGSGYVNGGRTYQITGVIGVPSGSRMLYLVDSSGNVLDSCYILVLAEVKFRGVATTDEAYEQAVCYGSYYVRVRVEEILYDPENTLEVGKEYEVCYGSDPKNIRSGDRLEVYGISYIKAGPFQYYGRVVAKGDGYYVRVIGQHVASTLVVYQTSPCTTGDYYFSSIQDAVNAANDGDTIIVCPGTYIENVYVDKSVEIRSYSKNPEDTVVKASYPYNVVFYVTADNVKISGFTVTGANYGIILKSTNNCRIENVKVSNNWYGIDLSSSSNNIITNNIVSNNNRYGIHLRNSSNNIITNNNFHLNGMFVYSSYNNTVANNTVNGKLLVYLENVSDYVVEDAGQVIAVNSNNVTVKNLDLSYTSVGIEFWNVSNSKIINNTVSNNRFGIDLLNSDSNIITNNIVNLNIDSGIYLCSSSNNIITSNTVLNNSYGIVTDSFSNNNTITNNNISLNSWIGIWLVLSNNSTITNNTVSLNYDGISFDESSNNIIANNILIMNDYLGIGLYDASSNNTIVSNTVLNNYLGIGLHASSNDNIITNNSISLNSYGIDLCYSSNNIIYLNNFIDNTDQVCSWDSTNIWNSTEKITYVYDGKQYTNYLGNYWSDYKGSDANGDGIGDIPYAIDGDADNYPLMEPWEYYCQPTRTTPKPNVTVSYEWHDGYINLTIQLRNEGEESNFGGVHIRLENATFVSVDKGTFDSVTAYDIIDPEAVDRDPANHTMEIFERPNVVELYVKGDSARATARIKPGVGDGLKIYYRAWLRDKDDTVYNPYTGEYEAYVARDPVEEPGDPRSKNPPYSRHVGDDGFSFIDYKCHDIRVSNVKILPVPYEYQDNASWCVLASSSMLLRYYGENVHVWDLARDLNLPKDKGLSKFDILLDLPDLLEEKYNVDVDVDWPPINFDNILKNIDEGRPTLLSIHKVNETGHAVVIVGYARMEDDVVLYIHDPSGALLEVVYGFEYVENIMPPIAEPVSWKLLKEKVTTLWPDFIALTILERPETPRNGSINVKGDIDANGEICTIYRSSDYQNADTLKLGDGGLVWHISYVKVEDNIDDSYFSPIRPTNPNNMLRLNISISNQYPFRQRYNLSATAPELFLGKMLIPVVNAEGWLYIGTLMPGHSNLSRLSPGKHQIIISLQDSTNTFDSITLNISIVAPNPRVDVSDCRLISPHEIEFKLKLANEGHAGDFSGVHVRVENGTFISADKGDFESVTAYDESGRPIDVECSRILEFYNRSVDGGTELETGWIRVRAENGIVKLLYRGWIKDDSAKIYNPYSKEFESYIARDPAEYEPVNPPYSRHALDNTFSFLDYRCHERPITVTPTPQVIYVPDDYAKIQWAVDNATAGDTIIVRDGTYTENVKVNKSLTIKSENGSANCFVQAAAYDAVFHVTADNVNISGFTIRGGEHGIYLDHAKRCNIANNEIWNSFAGIYLEYSSGNKIVDNNILYNWYGIYLQDSSNNTIIDNTMTNNGVFIQGDELRHWNTHIIENNTVNGKPLYYFKDRVGEKVPEDAGQVILANCTGMLVENLDIRNADVGILIGFSSKNTIRSNNFSDNGVACIHLEYSSYNIIVSNSFSNNMNAAINLEYSSYNKIAGNSIFKYSSIDLHYSSYNKITGNNISDCFGIYLDDSSDNIITGNKISSSVIFMTRSNNNVIAGNDILGSGVFLFDSSFNEIVNNDILDNEEGIQLDCYSSYNIIMRNNISNNSIGIYLESYSSNNVIYLNNFINNAESVYSFESTNVWNSTSQMTYTYEGRTYTNYMGNYWSDYTGSDADGDGIGDTPYAIDGDADKYPLMKPQENYFLPAPSPTPTPTPTPTPMPTPTPIPAQIFDTGRPENPYPSISGKFVGTIRTNTKIIAKKLYTYACEGTGGHTEYAIICNLTWCAEAKWEGYKGDWMNISFNRTVVLMPHETYNITIVTGSYPQIHHTHSLKTENGFINCTEFTDANGKKYNDWIPAIKLW